MLSVNGILLQVDKANEGKIVSKISMTVTTAVDEVDIKKCCRVCLLKQEPINLFCLFGSNKMFKDLSIAAAILDCFGVDLKQDEELPKYVCIKCASSTLQSYTFKKCLEKCQSYLEKQRETLVTKKLGSGNKINSLQETQGVLYYYLAQNTSLEQKQLLNNSSENSDNLAYGHNLDYSYNKNNQNKYSPVWSAFAEHNYCKRPTDMEIEIKCETENYFNSEGDGDETTNVQQTEKENDGKNKNSMIKIGNISKRQKKSPKDKGETVTADNFQETEKENSDVKIEKCTKNILNIPKRQKKLQEKESSKNNSKIPEVDKWWSREAGPPYVCKICGRSYDVRFRAFYMHARMHRMNKLSCIQCGKRFTRDKLIIHMRTHTNEKPYVCDQCPARFTVEGNLKRHLRCHTGEKLYVCDVCGKAFTQLTSLQNHQQAHAGKTLFVCVYCGKTFSSDNRHRSHVYIHHNKSKQADLNQENSNQERGDLVEKYTCGTCSKVFSKAVALRLHERIHLDGSKFHCGLCLKKFNSQINYRIHTVWHELRMEDLFNTQNKDWPCEFCSEVFSEKNALVTHILSHMERPFLCNTCGKSFVTKVALWNHSRQHSDEKPFNCTLCGKTFKFSALLKQHLRIHTGEKPHKCDVCSRLFAQQQQLLSHMLTHTGEKKHICPYCGKAFALNGNLTVHKRRHTGETPYVCDVCRKGFYDSSSLKKHKQGQHKNVLTNTGVDKMLLKEEADGFVLKDA